MAIRHSRRVEIELLGWQAPNGAADHQCRVISEAIKSNVFIDWFAKLRGDPFVIDGSLRYNFVSCISPQGALFRPVCSVRNVAHRALLFLRSRGCLAWRWCVSVTDGVGADSRYDTGSIPDVRSYAIS